MMTPSKTAKGAGSALDAAIQKALEKESQS